MRHNIHTQRFIKKAILLAAAHAGILSAAVSFSQASDIMSDPLVQSVVKDTEQLRIIKGELTTIDVKDLQRVSVGNPDIVDIIEAEGDNLLLIGKSGGQTPVFIWDANGRRTVTAYVVNEDLNALQRRIEQLLLSGGINGVQVRKNEDELRVVVTGDVPQEQIEKFEKIVEPFEDDGQAIVLINQKSAQDMVRIDLQITEISSTLFRTLGVDWFTGEIERSEETIAGQTFIQQTTTVNEDAAFTPDFIEAVPLWSDTDDTFKVGDFFRSQALVARINAMVQEGNAKNLSNPKLVVLSGEEASFLVGGEVPIRTTTTNQNGVSENVEFKEYGVGMTIVPTIKNNKVDVVLNMDITDIDRANATSQDLAFLVRSAQTRLLMDDGETVVLAGLIKKTDSETRRRIPYISKIPILGALFRSKATPVANEDTELVFAMTPHILRTKDASQSKPVTQVQYRPVISAQPAIVEPPKEEAQSDMQDYLTSLQGMIAESVEYPPEAAELGWEGTVKISMMLLSDGTLAFALVDQSSGYDMIDRSALDLVKRLTYPAFPSASRQKEITINIPIVYAQNR